MMGIAWSDLGVALGLVLVIEGALWFVAPNGMRRIVEQGLSGSATQVRLTGLIVALAGLAIVQFIRG